MRKSCLTILLSCLLVIAQLGAFVHGIEHHGDAAELRHGELRQVDHGDVAADSLCALCLAFAQLAAFAGTLAPAVALPGGPVGLTPSLPAQGRSVSVARGRNRDPPMTA